MGYAGSNPVSVTISASGLNGKTRPAEDLQRWSRKNSKRDRKLSKCDLGRRCLSGVIPVGVIGNTMVDPSNKGSNPLPVSAVI